MIKLIALWIVAFTVVSTVTFGVLAGVFSSLVFVPLDGQPITAGGVAAIAAYGMFYWLLLSAMTLPIFLSPLITWPFIARAVPVLERSRGWMIVGMSCSAIFGVVLRSALLEYPGWAKIPGSMLAAFVTAPSSYGELIATWAGLLLPRLCLAPLATGAFAKPAD